MLRFSSILLLVYYLFGSIFLPKSDFSALTDLPEMYKHCKTTEDKDMTPFDFITDHLMNIDGAFDKHDNGDDQKPHNPVPVNHQLQENIFVVQHFNVSLTVSEYFKIATPFYSEEFYPSGYISGIFRPPMV